MSLTRWLSNHLGVSRRPASRMKTPAARRRFRPMLEGLEQRWVPSTLTVTKNLDSGAGSLRAEIAAAHNGDTIVFDPGLDGQTITLASGELLINKNLTITGPGANQLTVSANNSSRIFEVAKSKQVDLSGLTISNGQAFEGGGIENYGTLTVNNCTFSSDHNLGTGAANSDGGGINNYGSLTVSNSTFTNNSAVRGLGAGIYNHSSGTLTLTSTVLSNNTGQAINNDGSVTINGCTFANNTAGERGAIDSGGPMTISNSSFSGNTTNTEGGAIHGANMTITGCTFSNNSASGSGGAIGAGNVTIIGCTFTNNSAPQGGAIYVAGTGVTVQSSTLQYNSAGSGGALWVRNSESLTVDGSTISYNTASTAGGGIYISNFAGGVGGTVTVKNSSTIVNNSAPVGFGADVYNLGTLYVDSSSMSKIGIVDGNGAVIPI